MTTQSPLTRLAERVERNLPQHGNPEKFHEEKSEIVTELKRLAKEAEFATDGY